MNFLSVSSFYFSAFLKWDRNSLKTDSAFCERANSVNSFSKKESCFVVLVILKIFRIALRAQGPMFMLCYLNIDSSSPSSKDPEASSSNSSKIYFTSSILMSSVLLCKYLLWEVFENRLRSQLIVSRFLRILFDEAWRIYYVI